MKNSKNREGRNRAISDTYQLSKKTNSKQYSKAIWNVFVSDSKLRWDLNYKIRDKIGAISNYIEGKPMRPETLFLHKIFSVCLSFQDLGRQQLTKWTEHCLSCHAGTIVGKETDKTPSE